MTLQNIVTFLTLLILFSGIINALWRNFGG